MPSCVLLTKLSGDESFYPLQLQEFMKVFGVSLDRIVQKVHIPNTLWQEELDITDRQYHDFAAELGKALDDGQLLALGDVRSLAHFLPPIHAALSAASGLSALHRLQQYKKLIGPMHIELIKAPTTVTVSLALNAQDLCLPRFGVLTEQATVVSLLRQGTGVEIQPVAACGPYPYSKQWKDFLGVDPVQAERNFLTFAVEDLKLPFTTENNLMWRFLEPCLNRELNRSTVTDRLEDKVRQQLLRSIPSGEFSADQIALQLGMSSRTLRRKLGAEGVTFKELVQSTQFFLAEGYLADASLTTDDVAFLVGYSEVSAFARAFKNWTGQTITQFKQETLKADSHTL